MKTTLAILALACLQACGGGADDQPPPPVQTGGSGPSCTPRVVLVDLLGDSTEFGYDSATQLQAVHNPGVELQAALDSKFGVGATVVTNYGVSGTQSSEAPKVSADVIVANYGINDMLASVPLATFASRMKAIGATLIETQLPVSASWSDGMDQWSYVNAAKGLGLPVADAYEFVLARPGWQAEELDGTHPTDALYKVIVDDVLAPAVAKQVAPLRCVKPPVSA